MKNSITTIFFLFVLISLVTSCKKTEGDKAETSNATEVAPTKGEGMDVDVESSRLFWVGTKPTGSHTGTVALESGKIFIEGGKLSGGNFTIDMNSISCTDLDGDAKLDIEAHLKGTDGEGADDFFNVNVYPKAKFEITKVSELINDKAANSLVYGNLTLKNVTKSIGFKANVSIVEGVVTVKAPQFTIDRTKWGVNYKSKTVFSELKEKFINDDIGLAINLKTR